MSNQNFSRIVIARKINTRTRNQNTTPETNAVVQVKTSNTSKNFLNEIRQIVYSLYWEKQISKRYTVIY